MTEPTTEAGKRLLESLKKLLPYMPLTWEGIGDHLTLVEAEGRLAALAEAEGAVAGMPLTPWYGEDLVYRSAALAAIRALETPR